MKTLQWTILRCGLLLSVCGVVSAQTPAQPPAAPPQVRSSLQTIRVDESAPQPVTVYTREGRFQAPNWTRDGASLIFDGGGKIMKIPVGGGVPEAIDIGAATRCTGSHGLSPDGALLAITCNMPERDGARVYVVPVAGGVPRLVTETGGSYWHSWSPDGKTIVFTRSDHGSLNFYAIPVEGGAESALTTGTGINDDPDYSPDGKYIYFNSDRGGSMQIWRMHPDRSGAEQMTSDELPNWTPHPSPDGKWIVFLSYEKGVAGHPADKNVQLRLMSLKDRNVTTLARFVGGSGTMNVPSWAPDSRSLAFVSYEVLAATAAVPAWAQPGSATHKQVAPPSDFHRPTTTFNTPIGVFAGQSDVGSAVVPGAASFDAATKQYTIHSAGYNIWYSRDEFRYLWKKMSGDVSLAGDIAYPDPNGYGDRKAVLVIRQSLDDDSKEAMVALHGVGMVHLAQRTETNTHLTDMEYRMSGSGRPGAASADKVLTVVPKRIGIEKHGDEFALWVSLDGEPMHQFGPPIKLHLDGPFYVGIGFCSHLPDKSDTAVLSNVVLVNAAGKVK